MRQPRDLRLPLPPTLTPALILTLTPTLILTLTPTLSPTLTLTPALTLIQTFTLTRCDNLEISDFSLERWTAIVTYKTAFYSFYLSVAFAMVYAGITDQVYLLL